MIFCVRTFEHKMTEKKCKKMEIYNIFMDFIDFYLFVHFFFTISIKFHNKYQMHIVLNGISLESFHWTKPSFDVTKSPALFAFQANHSQLFYERYKHADKKWDDLDTFPWDAKKCQTTLHLLHFGLLRGKKMNYLLHTKRAKAKLIDSSEMTFLLKMKFIKSQFSFHSNSSKWE